MKTTIKTWCPLFSGFYNTMWESDEEDEIEYRSDIAGRKLKYDDFDYDYAGYHNDVSKAFASWLSEGLKKIPGFVEMRFEELRSPREYNFATDAINVEIDIMPKKFVSWWRGYIKKNESAYAKYLHDKYTSCDGFWSHYENTIDGWIEETNSWTKLDGHYLGSMLQFYCYNEDISEYDAYEDLSGSGHTMSQYMTLKPIESEE